METSARLAKRLEPDDSKSIAEGKACCAAFLRVAECAWRNLDSDSRRAIRACSREGRVLYDCLWTRVGVSLRPAEDCEEGAPRPAPDLSPAVLTAALTAALERGCRPQEIVLSQFNDEDDFNMREQQALAVLAALSCPSLTSISLLGYTALTPALAVALSPATVPALTRLAIEFPEGYEVEAHGRGHDVHAFAAVSLLLAAGPRLRSLDLARVDHWPTLVLQALAVCRCLESLSMDMGFPEDDPNAMADEGAMLRAVASVTGLRSLTLKGGLSLTAADLQRHSSTLRCLSALSGLTHLSLQVSECFHREDSYSFEPTPQGRQRWSAAFGQQRSALAAALRCMPGLRSLDCGGMQLRAKDLSCLTALTCLKLGGVVLSEPSASAQAVAAATAAAQAAAGVGHGGVGGGGGVAVGANGGGGSSLPTGTPGPAGGGAGGAGGTPAALPPQPALVVGTFALPPQLRELHFGRPPSPRQLAALRPPQSLCRIVTTRLAWESPRAALTFNVRDVCPPESGGGGHGQGGGNGGGHGAGGGGGHGGAGGAAGGGGGGAAAGAGGAANGAVNRLLPDAAATMAAAAAMLAGRMAQPPSRPRIVVVSCDSGPGRLLAPEGQPDGHACWLPALAALGVEELVLGDLTLGLRDLLGLVEMLPGIKMLDLRSSSFPMAALPCLAALPELEEVQISLRTSPCAQETAESALLLLFAHAAAARRPGPDGKACGGLKRVRVDRVQAPPWAMEAVRSVQALLERKGLPGQVVV